MEQRKVGVVVVNWNGKRQTLDCLESLRSLTYGNYRVIVVDNGSTDGSQEAIASGFPDARLIECGRNLGFTGGGNVGMRSALDDDAEAVLLLNNDTVVAADLLQLLAGPLFSVPMVGAVNPKIYYYDDPKRIWSAGGVVDWRNGVTRQRRLNEIDDGQPEEQVELDYGVGCALMARRDAIESVGLLDDAFFAYYEEVEWCQRLRRRGYKIVYVPGAKVWHRVSTSLTDAPQTALYYFCRNRLLFLKRSGAGAAKLAPLVVTDFLRMAASFLVKKKFRESRAVFLAVSDYCRGRFGQARI